MIKCNMIKILDKLKEIAFKLKISLFNKNNIFSNNNKSVYKAKGNINVNNGIVQINKGNK